MLVTALSMQHERFKTAMHANAGQAEMEVCHPLCRLVVTVLTLERKAATTGAGGETVMAALDFSPMLAMLLTCASHQSRAVSAPAWQAWSTLMHYCR